jgi:Trypsin-like peptidase domain
MKKKFLTIFLSFFFLTSYSQTISKIESVQSLYIELFKDNLKLGSATGFIIQSKTRAYLVTNYHVVTNKKPTDNSWLDSKYPVTPNRIAIVHNAKILGNYVVKFEDLISNKGDTLWYQNTIGNEMVDVVEIPLHDTVGITTYPVNYHNTPDSILISPTDRVFIPGFPLGLKSFPSLPIWKSGFIASEPDIDQENKPIIWVDDIPFPGMSGSPVYLITKDLNYKNGSSSTIIGPPASFFIGVFSHGEGAVYGALWKGTYLKNIFDKLP